MTNRREGLSAVTLALRGPPSTSPISPTKSPGPSVAIRVPPRSTRSDPSMTTKNSWAVAPSPIKVCPAGTSTSSASLPISSRSRQAHPPKSGTRLSNSSFWFLGAIYAPLNWSRPSGRRRVGCIIVRHSPSSTGRSVMAWGRVWRPSGESGAALARRPVFAPAAEFADIPMDPLGELAREEDPRHRAAVGELHGPTIEARRLTRLDPRPEVVRQVVELARDGDAALRHVEHARMDVPDRIDPISRRGQLGL